MTNPQQPELRRSERGASSDTSAKVRAETASRPAENAVGPVPPDNEPGHHPEHDQDKPEGPPPRGARASGGRPRARTGPTAAAGMGAEVITDVEVDAGAARLTARASGPVDGHVVLCLHGFPQRAGTWDGVLPHLAAAGHRAVAIDQRGYARGLRPTDPRAYTVDHLVGDVLRVADGLGAERFSVVGHDWGGVVAWALGAAHPDRVVSVTSVSTPHPRAFVAALAHSDQAARSAYVGFFAMPVLPEVVLGAGGGRVLRGLLERSGLPAETAARYASSFGGPRGLAGPLNWYRAGVVGGGLAGIGDVTVPAQLVWGTADPALGRRGAEGTADHVSGPYRFVPLEGVGHWIPEVCADTLAPLLVDHIGGALAGSPIDGRAGAA